MDRWIDPKATVELSELEIWFAMNWRRRQIQLIVGLLSSYFAVAAS